MDTQQTENLIETEDFVSADEMRPEEMIFPCRNCGQEHDTDHLFCPKLPEISKMIAEKDGKTGKVWISDNHLELLAKYAECEPCTDPTLVVGRDIITLASAMAQCRDDNERHRNSNNGQRQQRDAGSSSYQSRGNVAGDEFKTKVLCVACLARGRVTKIRREDAKAPGWLGVQIMEGLRRLPLDLTSRDLKRIGSQDLLKDGLEAYSHCSDCIEAAVEILQEKAREMGYDENYLLDKIQAWSLVGMLIGVRKVEQNQG